MPTVAAAVPRPISIPATRPILYCTYHRAWYRDVSNFRDMPPMVIDRAAFERLGADHKWLMAWIFGEGG